MNDGTRETVLIVDDDQLRRVTLGIELREAGYAVLEASDAMAAGRMVETRRVDVVVTDLRMPEVDGLQFLEQIKSRRPELQVILMTAFGSIDTAVEAMKRGAYDYLTKPFDTEVLIEKLERLRAAGAIGNGDPGPHEVETLGSLTGRSHALRRLLQRIRKLAGVGEPVLVQGEAGAGKARVAETLHRISPRADRPYVTFACAAAGAGALERELTGAPENGGGPRAAGGTLVLEQVDALPADAQAALVGRLQQPAIADAAVSAGSTLSHDIRLIAITDRDLRRLVDEGRFRSDLYYLISTTTIDVPPLRERAEDIPVLAARFVEAARGPAARLHPHAIDLLAGYHWPGNVRELEQVVRQAAALCDGEEITPTSIQIPVRTQVSREIAAPIPGDGSPLTETIADVERKLIDAALKRAAGNQAKAAQFLGIPRTTLRDKMTKYGMVGDGGYRTVSG